MALPFRLHGASAAFNTRCDALVGASSEPSPASPTDHMVDDQDEDEIVDSMHTSMFHKERRDLEKWNFYSLEDVQLVTEGANAQAAHTFQQSQNEVPRTADDAQSFPRESMQFQSSKKFSSKQSTKVPKNNKEKSIVLLDEEGEEELNF